VIWWMTYHRTPLFHSNRFRQIPGLINIRTFENSRVIGEELHWDRVKDWGNKGVDRWQFNGRRGNIAKPSNACLIR